MEKVYFVCIKKKYTASEGVETMYVSREWVAMKIDVLTEQRYTVKFCVILKKLKLEMIALLKQAFQNKTSHDSTICRWHRAFTGGRVC